MTREGSASRLARGARALLALAVALPGCGGALEGGADADGGASDDAGPGAKDAGAKDSSAPGRDASSPPPPKPDAGQAPPPNTDAGTIPGCGIGPAPIPTEPIYECLPSATPSTGCPPFGVTVGTGPWYPMNCSVVLPQPQGGCGGPCCGAQRCYCQPDPSGIAAGAFVCPL